MQYLRLGEVMGKQGYDATDGTTVYMKYTKAYINIFSRPCSCRSIGSFNLAVSSLAKLCFSLASSNALLYPFPLEGRLPSLHLLTLLEGGKGGKEES